jgi:hypothetical protein
MKEVFRYATEVKLTMEVIRPMFEQKPAFESDDEKLKHFRGKVGNLIEASNIFLTNEKCWVHFTVKIFTVR